MSTPSSSRSSKLVKDFISLPTDVQQEFFSRHVAPLLDTLSTEMVQTVLAAVETTRTRYKDMPQIEPKKMKREINSLTDRLRVDTKTAMVTGRSDRDDITIEVVQSVIRRLNDIWSAVYEYRSGFTMAHECLMFASYIISKLGDDPAGCQCMYKNMWISIQIKDRQGHTVHDLEKDGVDNIRITLLWIWRELILSVLRTERSQDVALVPDILSGIEESWGIDGLEQMVSGGKEITPNGFNNGCAYHLGGDVYPKLHMWDSDVDFGKCYCYQRDPRETCHCQLHCQHWTAPVEYWVPHMMQLVRERLILTMDENPSISATEALFRLDPLNHVTSKIPQAVNRSIWMNPGAVAVALHMYSTSQGMLRAVPVIIANHGHLLRTQDEPVLLKAILALARAPEFHSTALVHLEQRLLSAAREIRALVASTFPNIEDDVNRSELAQILKLTAATTLRKSRLNAWAEAVAGPDTTPMGAPFAFMAAAMGLPVPPDALADDDDPGGLLDSHNHDPELDSLREILRPNLQAKFDRWSEATQMVTGGSLLLMKVYKDIAEKMPYMAEADCVKELMWYITNKPSKHHVCDAIESLSTFCKRQKKKTMQMERKIKKVPIPKDNPPTANVKTKSSAPSSSFVEAFAQHGSPFGSSSTSSTAGPSASSSTSPGPTASPTLPFPFSFSATYNGIDDVD